MAQTWTHDGTSYVLAAATSLADLAAACAAAGASAATVAMAGCDLAVDTDALGLALTLTGTGRLDLRWGGRLQLAASLPDTIALHAREGELQDANGSARNTASGLTANAAAEIHLASTTNSSNVMIPGGIDVPTGTLGQGWGLATAWSADYTQLTLDRDLDVAPGDYLCCAWSSGYSTGVPMTVAEVTHAENACTVRFTAAYGGGNGGYTLGAAWYVAAGGLLLRSSVSRNGASVGGHIDAGVLTIMRADGNSFCVAGIGTVDRMALASTSGSMGAVFGGYPVAPMRAGTVLGGGDVAPANAYCASPALLRIGERVGTEAVGYNVWFPNEIDGGWVRNVGERLLRNHTRLASMLLANSLRIHASSNANARVEFRDCQIAGSPSGWVDMGLLYTVRRMVRREFPADTDLPDAWYYAPVDSAVAEAWKTVWTGRIRRGRTLRLSARVFLAGEGAECRIGLAEAPELPVNPLPDTPFRQWDALARGGGILASARWSEADGDGVQAWRTKTLEWRNDTGEDVDVLATVVVAGAAGAIAAVWESTGGAM